MQNVVIDIKEAGSNFDALMKRVASGIHVILEQDDKPIAHISPASSRVAGLHAGTIKTAHDFDDELPHSFWISAE